MKAVKGIFLGYCVLCGLIVGPVLFAVGLALLTGALPAERLQRAFAVIRIEEETLKSSAGEGVEEPSRKDRAAQPPEDLSLWQTRLERMGTRVERNVDDLETEIARLREREEKLRELGKASAELLSLLLKEPVSPQDLETAPDKWTTRLRDRQVEEKRLPRLLETLKTVKPRVVAAILAGGDGKEGLGEKQVTRLLMGLPPRKAGEILTELGKTHPSLAARLIAQLGGVELSGTGQR